MGGRGGEGRGGRSVGTGMNADPAGRDQIKKDVGVVSLHYDGSH